MLSVLKIKSPGWRDLSLIVKDCLLWGWREMAQWLGIPATLPEGLGWIPRTHMVAHSICGSSSEGPYTLLLLGMNAVHIHIDM